MFYKFLIILFCAAAAMDICDRHSFASSPDLLSPEKEIADFLGVPVAGIYIECPQKTYEMRGKGKEKELSMCLFPQSAQNRCEVSVLSLPKAPTKNRVSMDIKPSRGHSSGLWHTLMQVQSFPDKGEEWRCPPFSLEIQGGHFRAYSRWDENKVSRTFGHNCTEKGSSLSARQVFGAVPVIANQWQTIVLNMKLSPFHDGQIGWKIGKKLGPIANGGNIFNDQRLPYLKLGIYKPAGWTEAEKREGIPNCVSYRNVKIVSFDAE